MEIYLAYSLIHPYSPFIIDFLFINKYFISPELFTIVVYVAYCLQLFHFEECNVCSPIQVWVHMGMTPKPEDFELCTRLENISLAKNGFFGVSAATGGLAGQ